MASRAAKELARTIHAKAQRTIKGQRLALGNELATITDRHQLQLDNFKHPLDDFLIADGLTIQPGDRVLAVPVSNGNDYVVLVKVKANG